MPTDQQETVYAIAERVAIEIYEGFRSYEGEKWEAIKGNERAVTFNVDAPSLKGKTVEELNPSGINCTGDFSSKLWSAGGTYVGRSLRGRTLHCIHYSPEIVNNEYTGTVAISEKGD